MHLAVSENKAESIKNMVDMRGETSLGDLFNAVDERGNSPLFCAKEPETVRTILDLDKNREIALERQKDSKPLAEHCIEQRYCNILASLIILNFLLHSGLWFQPPHPSISSHIKGSHSVMEKKLPPACCS